MGTLALHAVKITLTTFLTDKIDENLHFMHEYGVVLILQLYNEIL